MAKQRGIHQISGKVNNLCYYEQKYVRGGLIRRINEAMSERLKTDPVFKNTRYSNKIFGGCSMFAGVLLSFFGNRNSFLFKPYRQAILTRAVQNNFLEYNVGMEYPTIGGYYQVAQYLSRVVDGIVKNSIFNSFPELIRLHDGLVLEDTKTFTFSYDSLEGFCKKYKCIGVQLIVSRAHYIYASNYDPELKEYGLPENNAGGRGSYINWYLHQGDGDVVLETTTGTIDDATTFWIVNAYPILSIYQDRPVIGETGASCGLILFKAS